MKKLLPYLLIFAFIAGPQAGFTQQRDSLDIMIGQMILIGIKGTDVTAGKETLEAVKNGLAGSVILFEKNIADKDSYVRLKRMTSSLQAAAPLPLFIGIDQEGGRVNRMKSKYGFPRSVTHKYLGTTGSVDSTRFYAELTAATLSSVGINVNFAPVVDLEINRSNPVIARYGRSFSADPDSVIMHAAAFMDAHRYYGVIPVLKHFPGHGSSAADTHMGIADVTQSWQRDELRPYSILIRRGTVDAIMSAHIVHRKLDHTGRPGTLSEPILGGILRDSLNFDGVVFSDDMHMKAVSEHYGLRESIKLAVNAGIDILCFSHNLPDQRESSAVIVHKTLKELVQDGEVPMSRIRESYQRILELKMRL